MNDLKQFNSTLPSGSKLKNYALLPENALSRAILPPLHMRKIRHALLGEQAKIPPLPQQEITHMTDAEWRAEADNLYAKTEKDGVEHMRILTSDGASREFVGIKNGVDWIPPKGAFSSIHTHPAEWDSPLSETDISGFLLQAGGTEMAATSKEAIYIATKKKGYKAIKRTQILMFEDEFHKEIDRLFGLLHAETYSDIEYHNMYLKAGKEMAKRYGLEYRVIKRRP